MKILLIHPDASTRAFLRHQIEEAGHVVVHEYDGASNLINHLARFRPHALIAGPSSSEIYYDTEAATIILGLKVRAFWLKATDDLAALKAHLDSVLESLTKPEPPAPLVPYVQDSRTILIDDAYPLEGKRNIPAASQMTDDLQLAELQIFGRQVERAVRHHKAASRYLRQVLVIDRGLRTEIAYRAVHSSFKVYWLREHIARWLAVLAHYLTGVDTDYLPSPTPPSPRLDYLHHVAPPESYYVLTGVLNHGLKPSWVSPLHDILEKKFSGQDEEALLRDALELSGWSALLREIAMAQVEVMACALDPRQPWYTRRTPPRPLHRATGIYCDFWHLRCLRQNPEQLRGFANAVVANKAMMPDSMPVVPPFRHFVRVMNTNQGAA